MRRLFRILPMLLIPYLSQAQERCGTGGGISGTGIIHNGISAGESNSMIVIPVVVHVIWRTAVENISDEQIRSQIDALNADFSRKNADFAKVPAVFATRAADAGIRFVLATVDPQGRPINGIIRKQTNAQLWINDDRIKKSSTGGSDAWESRQYLNIWVANLSSSLIGFSTFPGAPADKDGIVIRYNAFGTKGTLSPPYDQGRTLTHEIGHWLGLQHLWGDSPCGDDGVDDTPKQRAGNRGTPQFPRINTGCDNGPHGDMFMNFMDFSDDRSLLMFTKGQTDRMRAQFRPGAPRHSLLNSKGAGEPWNLQSDHVPGVSNPIQIHPNPADRYLNVRSSSSIPKTYTIVDANGRVVMAGTLITENPRIDIRPLRPGLHYLRLGDTVIRWIKTT
jgi:hypothetical protein